MVPTDSEDNRLIGRSKWLAFARQRLSKFSPKIIFLDKVYTARIGWPKQVFYKQCSQLHTTAHIITGDPEAVAVNANKYSIVCWRRKIVSRVEVEAVAALNTMVYTDDVGAVVPPVAFHIAGAFHTAVAPHAE